jgi:P-type E1-E2 ATPase
LPQEKLEFYQKIVFSLEAKSQHPVAFAIREWLKTTPLEMENVNENPQKGVEGYYQGRHYEVFGFEKNAQKHFGLFSQGELLWSFRLKAKLQEDSQHLVHFFHEKKLPVHLISGDFSSEVLEVGESLGIAQGRCWGQLSPEQKKTMVQSSQGSLMIGDGFNDSLALKSAFVSLAAYGSVDTALKTSDAFFIRGGFKNIAALFCLAEKAKKQIRRNIGFAIVYNLLGAGLAILGFVNPFVAAVLMPISSSLILLFTIWGLR